LVTKVAASEAKSFANKLAVNSDFSMKFTKKMISDISNLNVNEAVDYCIRLNTISRSSEDFKKGIEDFLLKKNAQKIKTVSVLAEPIVTVNIRRSLKKLKTKL